MMEATDNKSMELGVSMLLGKVPYKAVPAPPSCDHEDDGYVYGETDRYVTLMCTKCREFYDKPK